METVYPTAVVVEGDPEPGGQNAERQWRRKRRLSRFLFANVSRGAERRKAMETRSSPAASSDFKNEPGGQNAERQWRLGVGATPLWHCSTSRGGRTPKGNGDEWRNVLTLRTVPSEPGGQNAERQWRRRSQPLPCGISAVKPGGRTPKGNGGGTALAAESKQVGAAGWTCPRLALECRTSADVRFSD